MTILQISVLSLIALAIGQLRRGRELGMLAVSVLAIFWLQPAQPFASLGYWLPVATLALTTLCWALTSMPQVRGWRQNWAAACILVGVAFVGGFGRFIRLESAHTADFPALVIAIIALIGISGLAIVFASSPRLQRFGQSATLVLILIIFVFLKSPALGRGAMETVGSAGSADPTGAATALSWLGYSYLAFRLMHTIRDRQSGRMPAVTLSEYVNYVIFFPSFTAGPIDRVERFVKDLCAPLAMSNADWIEAGSRLFIGLFKKFVIADMLAVISINDVLVRQVQSSVWLWVFLYAYAFRIYFDFSGYTDIAIGMGRLLGIYLPENFNHPYLRTNLTQFWNSWHMSLTQWFRAYVFNPMARSLRTGPLPVWLIILITQVTTMLLIGLWHGITWSFAVWGLWHGLGLFLHNRWSEFARNRMPVWTQVGWGEKLTRLTGLFLTFNYVALGWLFFTLPEPQLALLAMQRLFGLA